MKVVHVITGLSDGGAEVVLYRLVTHDKAYQHHVISLMGAGKYGASLRRSGVAVTCLSMPRGRVTLRGLWWLWRTLRQQRPDVVQTWMYHSDLVGGVIARLAGLKAIYWGIRQSNLDLGSCRRSTIWTARLCAWLSPYIPKRVICCAQRASEVHAALGYCRKKLLVIPNGYNLSQFRMDPAAREMVRRELRVDGDTALIGMVARFDAQKDHGNLLRALTVLRDSGRPIRCVLVGTGMVGSNPALAALIDQYRLRQVVVLLGQRSDIPAIMNALDVHVLSSLGEAFPNVLAEAMACGTPCVTTDVGDAAHIVDDTGWVVPPRDSEQLTAAITRALDARAADADAWRIRQHACRRRIGELFSIEAMVERYHQVWAAGAAWQEVDNSSTPQGFNR